MPLLLLLAAAFPALAQFRQIEIRFTGVNCAPCLESLPSRITRMRGVESASVDAAQGVLRIRLAPENRVRIELVRDQIEQDGTRAASARVRVSGSVEKTGDGYLLKLPSSQAVYALEGRVKEGRSELNAIIGNLRPSSGPIVLKVSGD